MLETSSIPFPYCFLPNEKLHHFSQIDNRLENALNLDRLNPFPKQALVFKCLQCKSLENTVGKREIARHEQFLLFPVFSTCLENFCHFHQVQVCRLQTH